MKKNFKKAAALVLAGSMLLSGCGASTGSKEASTAGTTEGTTAAAAPVETVAESTLKDGEMTGYDWMKTLPKLSDEKVTFKLVGVLNTEQHDFGTMNFFKALEEATNVHIEWQCYPMNSYSDQKNIMLASGDIPDAFFGGDSIGMTDLIQYGPMGLFIPVDDLIAKDSPNYQARLAEYPTLDGLSTAFDGKKYSWGTINMHPNRDYPDNLYINKVWLDNLGLKVPETMDEFYDVLKAFKEQDPNKNGIADEIPYTFSATHHIQ
ncbi:MAG: extracellular solute-binding protein, partial [Hungatella sp.]